MSARKMRKAIVAATSAAALVLALALPVAALGVHTSCQGFAAECVAWVHGGWAESGDFENPGFGVYVRTVPEYAYVAVEHELYCD